VLSRLLILFVGVPLLELILLLKMGSRFGFLPTLGLVIVTGVIGGMLARSQGLKAFSAVQKELAQGQMPGKSLMDGMAVLVGGAFLLTPGVLTDLVGFSLLIPWSRKLIQDAVGRSMNRGIQGGRIQVRVFGQGGGPAGVGFQQVETDADLKNRSEVGLGE